MSVPPCPVVCLLSSDGSLLLYDAVNRQPGAESNLVHPPQPKQLVSSEGTSAATPAAQSQPASTHQEPTKQVQCTSTHNNIHGRSQRVN